MTTRLYITCEKSRGLPLAEPGLTAGRLADEFWVRFEILKLAVYIEMFNFLLCLAKVLHCFSNFDAFLMLFSGKPLCKVVLWNVKFCRAV